jgi:integrase
MSITLLPSGRLRVQVYDPATGKNVSVAKVLGLKGSAATFPATRQGRRDAVRAREDAREKLAGGVSQAITVDDFRDRWLSDPLFRRPKESTMIRLAEQTKAFARVHGRLPMSRVDDVIVAQWLAGGRRNSQVKGLRAMWNDAASPKAGRLVDANPWARLGIAETRGNRGKQPASEELVWEMIAAARRLAHPWFAAWLQVACFSGMRPGELDILRWANVDLGVGRIRVVEQFNASTRTVTLPKNGLTREAVITPNVRAALLALPRESEFVFLNLRGNHLSPSSRAYHWKAVRAAAGWEKSLYLATRHFAGWYMTNELELPAEDVAIALGHTDGGDLVRKLYGHRETGRALDRVAAAYDARANVRPLRVVPGGATFAG